MNIQLHDPRPDDMAELAKKTAIELRNPSRGIWAAVFSDACFEGAFVVFVARAKGQLTMRGAELQWYPWLLTNSIFDNLGPVGCADVIQTEESRKAREWAGDP